jgi:hypothetical protein
MPAIASTPFRDGTARPTAGPGLGPPAYRRDRDLPRLIALWPAELEEAQRGGNAAIIVKIKRALRAERRRGVAGHWTYDLARHHQLLDALKAEIALAAKPGGSPATRGMG